MLSTVRDSDFIAIDLNESTPLEPMASVSKPYASPNTKEAEKNPPLLTDYSWFSHCSTAKMITTGVLAAGGSSFLLGLVFMAFSNNGYIAVGLLGSGTTALTCGANAYRSASP